MRYRQIISHIARKLPTRTHQDVKEILDLLLDIWMEELAEGRTVNIPDIGVLKIEVQDMKVSETIRQRMKGDVPDTLPRIYGRFKPTNYLKEQIMEDA